MEVRLEKLGDVVCKKCEQLFSVADAGPLTAVVCPHCRAGNLVPAQIGDTLIIDLIGAGGQGLVYRALDLPLQRQVAVKLVRGQSTATLQRSVNEAQAQAKVSHPNVAQIHAIHLLGKQPVIVMELIDGGRLSSQITKNPPMDEARAVTWVLQIASGLQASWEAGLVFGDVKPSNILLSKKGEAKLTDFGLSRELEPHVLSEQASAGSSTGIGSGSGMGSNPGTGSGMNSASSVSGFGTAAYIAPEVVQRKPADHRSDIYSLGVTAFQMLTGELPFSGGSKAETIGARMGGMVPEVCELRPTIHPRTNAVVKRMMAFLPEDRHQSYAELIDELELARLAAQGDVLSELISGPAPEKKPESKEEDPLAGLMTMPAVETASARPNKLMGMASAVFKSVNVITPAINKMMGAGGEGKK